MLATPQTIDSFISTLEVMKELTQENIDKLKQLKLKLEKIVAFIQRNQSDFAKMHCEFLLNKEPNKEYNKKLLLGLGESYSKYTNKEDSELLNTSLEQNNANEIPTKEIDPKKIKTGVEFHNLNSYIAEFAKQICNNCADSGDTFTDSFLTEEIQKSLASNDSNLKNNIARRLLSKFAQEETSLFRESIKTLREPNATKNISEFFINKATYVIDKFFSILNDIIKNISSINQYRIAKGNLESVKNIPIMMSVFLSAFKEFLTDILMNSKEKISNFCLSGCSGAEKNQSTKVD